MNRQDDRDTSQNKREVYQNQRDYDTLVNFMAESIKERALLTQKLDNLIAKNTEDHGELIKQTTKTNGNVSDLMKWRWMLSGAFIVINIVVIPILMWLVFAHLKGG